MIGLPTWCTFPSGVPHLNIEPGARAATRAAASPTAHGPRTWRRRATIRTPRRNSPTSSGGRGALHRRSAALRAPTTPAEEAAFVAEFEKIEAESDQVEWHTNRSLWNCAAAASRQARRRLAVVRTGQRRVAHGLDPCRRRHGEDLQVDPRRDDLGQGPSVVNALPSA
jgi:hypothetical protein